MKTNLSTLANLNPIMLMLRLFTLISMVFFTQGLRAQNASKTQLFVISKNSDFNPMDAEPDDFAAQLVNLEAPSPDGASYRSFLMRQKIASRSFYQEKITTDILPRHLRSVPEPIINDEGFIPTRRLSNGTIQTLIAGIPSDNTCAISKEGIVLIGVNSHIYAYDTKGDSALFPNHNIPLNEVFSSTPTFSNFYDPKVLYDPEFDRFVLTFLRGNTPTSSRVIMCFSSTNNPADPWYVYELPGNPLNNERWTDFPCLSITSDKVYYTANLIIPNVSWQVGFDGSIIWEMDKNAAYAGEDDIQATLYHDIKFEDRFVRNLHPVNGADGTASELILLSNRNFDIVNDTVFFVSLKDGEIDVQALTTDLPYGVPPNGRQSDTDTADATMGLQTNDARVLGAILFDDELQFVANSVNPNTGNAAIYHGKITWADGFEVKGSLIADDVRDFAYPNIAWSGNETCDREVIINFLYSAPDIFPGSAVVYCDNEGNYSDVKTIKEGENIVDRLPGGYERWGDYTGLQRRFDKPGSVYSFTYHALADKRNVGFGVEILSPDSTAMQVQLELTNEAQVCGNYITPMVQGGQSPFTYFWNGAVEPGGSVYGPFCLSESVTCTVVDGRGCSETVAFISSFDVPEGELTLFPNPNTAYFVALFSVDEVTLIEANLYDSAGNLVTELMIKEAQPGINQLTFSTATLAQGVYHLVVYANGKKIHQEKVIKG